MARDTMQHSFEEAKGVTSSFRAAIGRCSQASASPQCDNTARLEIEARGWPQGPVAGIYAKQCIANTQLPQAISNRIRSGGDAVHTATANVARSLKELTLNNRTSTPGRE